MVVVPPIGQIMDEVPLQPLYNGRQLMAWADSGGMKILRLLSLPGAPFPLR